MGPPGGGDLMPSLGAGRGAAGESLAGREPTQERFEHKSIEPVPELPKPAHPETAKPAIGSEPRRKPGKTRSAKAKAAADAEPAKRKAATANKVAKGKVKAAAKKTRSGR